MWVPLLLVGAAAAGILIAKKYYDDAEPGGLPPDTPDVPGPPPGVINVSMSNASSFVPKGSAVPEELVWVWAFAMNADRPDRTYAEMPAFPSLQLAAEHYDTLQRFFDKNHGWWTCPTGSVWMEMWGFGPGDEFPHRFEYDIYACDPNSSNKMQAGSATPTIPPSSGAAPTKPLYIVQLFIEGGSSLQESFIFTSDAEAELYFRVLKTFFDQPLIRQAYTSPVGTIVLSKYGTKPARSRSAVYSHDGEILGPQ